MGKFADNVWFETEVCCACGLAFAMPSDFQQRRRNDHKLFYCPSGHAQHYNGKSEAEKLREKLAQRDASLANHAARANALSRELEQVSKAHRKMRQRVMNGVCPCCNRSFGNLREHMASQHPDFGQEQTFKALRHAFGMRQAQVAAEAGVNLSYVSLFERGLPVSAPARRKLEGWLESQRSA